MLYLTLRQYEYVTAIARQNSLSAAAVEVNVSQPALSAALSRIESHLGVTLFFRRKGAALLLTPEGRAFVEQANELLAHAQLIENRSQPRPHTTSMTLGCFVDLAPLLLAPALHMTRTRFPDIDIKYRVDSFQELTTAMMTGHVDIAISYDLGLDAGFDCRVLDQAVPCALVAPGHPFEKRSEISLADLAKHPLILFQEGLSAQHALALFRSNGLNPYVVHRAASLEIMRSLAAHGEGVGISYTQPTGPVSYDGKPVRAIPISDPGAVESIVLARYGTEPADPQIAGVIEALVQEVGRPGPGSSD